MTSDLCEELRTTSTAMGVEFFGIAPAAGFENADYQGNRPRGIMPAADSVIVLAVKVPRGCIEPLPQARAEYTNTLLAGTVTLRLAAFRLAQALESKGHRASVIPIEGSEFGYWYADKETLKADVSVKYAAYLAGMGRYGVSNLLLLPEIGPRVRMTAVVTDAVLEKGAPLQGFKDPRCEDCLACVKVCPAGALHADGSISRHGCKEYMFSTLEGLRCGLCVKACVDVFER